MLKADNPERLTRLEIPGRVSFLEGNGEMTRIEINSDLATAGVYLHGAHVTDFRRKDDPHPLLFTSQFSRFDSGHPIRGGIPIVFPWFGAREDEPMHGFARVSEWDLHEATAVPETGLSLRFGLPEVAASAMWPAFTANYVVTVTDKLQLELIVTNASPDQDLSFETCLHTYFAVGDISEVTIGGLKGIHYLDKVDNYAQRVEEGDVLRIESEVDRVFFDTPGPVEIQDRKWRRKIRIEKAGSQSTVVWNPWINKSQQLPDFGNDEYRQMVCVESGNVGRNAVSLRPGRSAVLKVELSSAAW